MDNFNEAQKNFMDAKAHHENLVKDLQNLIVKPPMMPKLRKIDSDFIETESRKYDFPKLPKALESINRLTWGTAWLHPDVKYRMSVRKAHAAIEAHNEILKQLRRKYARVIQAQIEDDPIIDAMREKITELFWCRVTAEIQRDWQAIAAELLKKPSDEKLRQAKPKFLAKYGLD